MDANTLNLIGRAKHGIPVDAAATLLVELDSLMARDRSPRTGREDDQICRRYRSRPIS